MTNILQSISQVTARSETSPPAEKPSQPLSTQASESVPDEIAPRTASLGGGKVASAMKIQQPISAGRGHYETETSQKTKQIFLSLQSEILESIILSEKEEFLDFISWVSDQILADRDRSEKSSFVSQSGEKIENLDNDLKELENATNKFDFVNILRRIATKKKKSLTYEQVRFIQESSTLRESFPNKMIGRIWA